MKKIKKFLNKKIIIITSVAVVLFLMSLIYYTYNFVCKDCIYFSTKDSKCLSGYYGNLGTSRRSYFLLPDGSIRDISNYKEDKSNIYSIFTSSGVTAYFSYEDSQKLQEAGEHGGPFKNVILDEYLDSFPSFVKSYRYNSIEKEIFDKMINIVKTMPPKAIATIGTGELIDKLSVAKNFIVSNKHYFISFEYDWGVYEYDIKDDKLNHVFDYDCELMSFEYLL